MLSYDEDSQNVKLLAIHYASEVGGNYLLEFMSGQVGILSKEQAETAIKGFWQMTDLAIEDNHANKTIEGITDVEFWMHKLFIKVNGCMTKSAFNDLWNASVDER